MTPPREINAEFIFRCFDCGSCCESWRLSEMLDYADRHQGLCDGREEPGE